MSINQGLTIVVADDDDGHAHLIEVNLERSSLNASIVRARDGKEAIEILRELLNDPSNNNQLLLLLDIRMPVMDGFEVLCTLRKDLSYAKIPIIMLTTSDDPREVSRCYENGCNAYIAKPLQANEFMQTINNLAAFLKVLELPNSAQADLT